MYNSNYVSYYQDSNIPSNSDFSVTDGLSLEELIEEMYTKINSCNDLYYNRLCLDPITPELDGRNSTQGSPNDTVITPLNKGQSFSQVNKSETVPNTYSDQDKAGSLDFYFENEQNKSIENPYFLDTSMPQFFFGNLNKNGVNLSVSPTSLYPHSSYDPMNQIQTQNPSLSINVDTSKGAYEDDIDRLFIEHTRIDSNTADDSLPLPIPTSKKEEGFYRAGPKAFVCRKCNLVFNRKFNCQSHVRTHIPNRKKPHVCDCCGSDFDRKNDLSRHKIHYHSKDRPHKCSHCRKAFPLHKSLLSHIKRQHKVRSKI